MKNLKEKPLCVYFELPSQIYRLFLEYISIFLHINSQNTDDSIKQTDALELEITDQKAKHVKMQGEGCFSLLANRKCQITIVRICHSVQHIKITKENTSIYS